MLFGCGEHNNETDEDDHVVGNEDAQEDSPDELAGFSAELLAPGHCEDSGHGGLADPAPEAEQILSITFTFLSCEVTETKDGLDPEEDAHPLHEGG